MNRRKTKKVSTLYETRLSIGYVITTLVCYIFAAVIWYMLCAFVPYIADVNVDADTEQRLTRAQFTATSEDILADEKYKERALFMPTSERSFYRRLRLVSDAKQNINLILFQTYNDVGSEYFYTSLVTAADRGVRVRIIFDGKMHPLIGDLAELKRILQNHNNIECYYINPVNLWKPEGLMVFSHDKLMTVDGDKMIIGGANMGFTSYLGNRDAEVMITNSGAAGVVGQADRYFESMRISALTVRKTSKSCDFNKKAELISRFSAYFNDFQFDEDIDYGAQGTAVDKISFLSNPISDVKKQPIIYTAIKELARTSQTTYIVTPYALLTPGKKNELKNIAAANKRFVIATNSLSNSHNVAYSEYYNTRKDFLSENIELWELQTKQQSHAKLYSFDGKYSVIGSFNLDERSIHIDTECVVIIDSPQFNAVLNNYIESEILAKSLRVGMDNKYIHSFEVAPSAVPLSKIIRARLLFGLEALINIL